MSSSLNPEAVEIIHPHHNEYGPGDTSDSASDVAGSDVQEADTSTGTGARSSVESAAPSETDNDLAPDKIVRILDGDVNEEEADEQGGDDTYADEELDARDGDNVEDEK